MQGLSDSPGRHSHTVEDVEGRAAATSFPTIGVSPRKPTIVTTPIAAKKRAPSVGIGMQRPERWRDPASRDRRSRLPFSINRKTLGRPGS